MINLVDPNKIDVLFLSHVYFHDINFRSLQGLVIFFSKIVFKDVVCIILEQRFSYF